MPKSTFDIATLLSTKKGRKKDKFKDQSNLKKDILLNLMMVGSINSVKECAPNILSIINQKSEAQTKQEAEADLANCNCACTMPTFLISCAQSGDQLSFTPVEPSNFTILCLGMRKLQHARGDYSFKFEREGTSREPHREDGKNLFLSKHQCVLPQTRVQNYCIIFKKFSRNSFIFLMNWT